MNSDITGGNLASAGISSPRACSDFCLVNPGCNSWVSAGGACYLKTGTTLIPHPTATSGIKCSVIGTVTNPTGATTNQPAPTTNGQGGSPCDGKCPGSMSNFYGCNPSFNLAYCNSSGGCSYSQQPVDSPNWCCIKGC